MYRSKLILGAAIVAGLATTQLASAEGPSGAPVAAAQGGVSVSPSILETTARSGASRSATITNRTNRKLRFRVRARPWRQSRSGAVAANRRRSLAGVRVRSTRFALGAGATRTVSVTLARMPRRRSQYGALEVVGRPTRRRRGINVAYRLISSVRFNPTARARRYRLGVGRARAAGRGSRRTLVLAVRNRGNTVDPVGGSASVSGSRGGRSAGITPRRILPGRVVNLRLMSLSGLRRGSYRASVTLTQGGRNQASVTRRFRIR